MAVWSFLESNEIASANRWDAEAFSPFLRSLDIRFQEAPILRELADVSHPAEITRIYSDSLDAPLFLLAQNIRPMLPDTSTEFRIEQATAAKIPTNRLENGDVLVTRSGANSGMCAVYLGKDGGCYTSGEGIIVRRRDGIDGAYLASYLNTSAGEALCKRAMYGSGQPHIGPKYLELTPVPRLGIIEDKVAGLVKAAYQELENSRTLYPDAEAELLERIGWDVLKNMPVEMSYVIDFDTLIKGERSDAEFFQPQHARLRAELIKLGGATIGSFCPKPSRGVQPEIIEGGEIIVVDSKAVRPQGVEPAAEERTSRMFYDNPANAKGRVGKGDVLLNSTGRGTLGRAACYQLSDDAICDNHVAILRPDPKTCHPVYLALFLNSFAGLSQSEQFQTGSSGQLEIYPEHIKNFIIFLPKNKNGKVDIAWQKRLAAKVEASTAAKVKAREKLDQAIEIVEKAISRI